MAGNAPEASQQPVISGVTAPQLTQIMTVALTAALQSIPGLTQPAQPAQTAPANQVPQPHTQFAPPAAQAAGGQAQTQPPQEDDDSGFSDEEGEEIPFVGEEVLDVKNWGRILRSPEALNEAYRALERYGEHVRDTARLTTILDTLRTHLHLVYNDLSLARNRSIRRLATHQIIELMVLNHQAHGRLNNPHAAEAFRARARQRNLPSYLTDAMHSAVEVTKMQNAFRSNAGGVGRARRNHGGKRSGGGKKKKE